MIDLERRVEVLEAYVSALRAVLKRSDDSGTALEQLDAVFASEEIPDWTWRVPIEIEKQKKNQKHNDEGGG